MSLPRYPKYKDSGLDWLDVVPEHWEIKPLKKVVDPLRPITYGIVQAGPDIEGGVPYIRPTDMEDENGISNLDALLKTTPEIAESYSRSSIRQGDLVCSIGPSFGKVMITPVELDGANLTQGTARVSVDKNSLNRFVFWSLRSIYSNIQWEVSIGGATFRALNLGPLAETRLAIPQLIEQSAIATFLDRETGKIDALIAEQEKLLTLLAEKRQATISHAVTKGLNPDVPMKDSGVEWLGEVPAHWRVLRVKDVAKLESGHTPSKQFPEYWENCDIPWVSLNDSKYLAINDYISETTVKINELGLANSSARMLPAGSVVFTRDATIGLAAITTVPMAVSQHLIAWCPSRYIDSVYLLRVFNALKPHLDSYTFGATIKTIGMGDVKKLVTPLPPIEEQIAISSFINVEIAKLDNLTVAAIKAIELLKERRTALISAAVTGKIDVRNAVTEEVAA